MYDNSKEDDEGESAIPPLSEGDTLVLRSLESNQHFTQPPARYTDAALIETMEKTGIGRPSTYAPTIATVIKREYVEREKRSLKPTILGEVTTGLMRDLFKDIVDSKFTALMEKDLDLVAAGELDYVTTLQKFYEPFSKTLAAAEEKMEGKHAKIPDVETDEICPNCGKKMVIKIGRFGKFLACPGYPECKTTKPIVTVAKGECPKCGGRILEKKSRKGYKYFGCENNKTCDFMTWDTPTDDKCPQCGKTLFKRRGGLMVCNAEGCGFEKAVEKKSKSKKKAEPEDE